MNRFAQMLALYLVVGAVGINVFGTMAANTAEGIKRAQSSRIEKLCRVNPAYCN